MAVIPSFFMNSVVALGVDIPGGDRLWIGTGVLVGRKEEDDPEKSTVYVVTNKHVVTDQSNLYVKFNNRSDKGTQDLLLTLYLSEDKHVEKNYTEHPDENVDIVAIMISPQVIVDNDLDLSFIDIGAHSLTLESMQETGVREGSIVYAVGFPMNLVDDIVKAPICRIGCISKVADAFIKPEEATAFLVDTPTFPGNSGGPIFTRPEHMAISGTASNANANMIGVLSGYIPYQEILISSQTGRKRMIQEENSGLTFVHPVDRIKEVIDAERARNK